MGKTGCVLGAGEDENGCRQGQTDAKSRCLNQCEHHNHTTHVKRKPAETQCFCRFCGRGRRTRTLGTRFWSGCGKAHWGTGKGQCYPVLPNKSQKSGAGLVLTPDFAAIRLSFGLRIDSRLAGKILDNLSIGKDDLSFAIGGNVLVMGD